MTTSKASKGVNEATTTNEHNPAGELPALPKPAVPAMQRGYPGMQPSYTQPDYYTAEQIRERDAMWQAKLDALAASHCAQGDSQHAIAHGRAVAWLEWDGFSIAYSPTDAAKRLPVGRYDLYTAPPSEPFGEDIGWCAEGGWPVETPLFAAPPSQPADKPAGQAVTDARPQVPSAVIEAIQEYGDARADCAADTARNMGARLATCSVKMGDAISTLRDWVAALAPEPATAAADALRWIMRFADKCKKPCGDDPESPTAIRNAHFATIGAAAAQGLGLVRGPSLAVPAAAVPDDLLTAGSMLANCAYNLAQDGRLSDRHRASLDESRKAWDAARRKLAAAPNRPADAQRGVPNAMTEASRVPDDYRNQASGYRAGWNDAIAASPSDPLSAPEQSSVAAPEGWMLVEQKMLEQVFGMAGEGCDSPQAAHRWCERIDALFYSGHASDEYSEFGASLPREMFAAAEFAAAPASEVSP